jgi:hypothetical protein
MDYVASFPVVERFAVSLAGLRRSVAARIGAGMMAAAMILLVWRRIARVDQALQALMARFQSGTLRVVATPRMGGGGGGARDLGSRLPLRFGWLLGVVPFEAAAYAGQVRAVLAEPEMVALIAAAPQARRVLAPLCRMLGIEREVLTPRRVVGDAVDVASPGVGVVRVVPAGWFACGASAPFAGGVSFDVRPDVLLE